VLHRTEYRDGAPVAQ